jgi:peptide/nickel transport system permease protein
MSSPTLASQPLSRLTATEAVKTPRGRAVIRFLRRNPLALFGLIIFAVWVAVSIFAPAIAPYGPLQQDIVNRLQGPSAAHWFGTDQLGRDIFTRVLYGGRLSLPAGLMVVILAGFIGTALGAVAGFVGGWAEEGLMRMTEVFMAFPTIILAMAIAAALGPSLINAVLAMVVVWWPNYARVVRALVLTVKNNDYVDAARALGTSESRILWRTVLPNCIAPVLVLATLDLGNAILIFAGLSFLGLGPEPSSPEWGRMVADGIQYFDQWWLAAFPGLAIFTVVIAFNFIGDGLGDSLDPKLRKGL